MSDLVLQCIFLRRCLATSKMFQDLEEKLLFINFAVTHCPVDIITNVLKERQLIEIQVRSLIVCEYVCIYVHYYPCTYLQE